MVYHIVQVAIIKTLEHVMCVMKCKALLMVCLVKMVIIFIVQVVLKMAMGIFVNVAKVFLRVHHKQFMVTHFVVIAMTNKSFFVMSVKTQQVEAKDNIMKNVTKNFVMIVLVIIIVKLQMKGGRISNYEQHLQMSS